MRTVKELFEMKEILDEQESLFTHHEVYRIKPEFIVESFDPNSDEIITIKSIMRFRELDADFNHVECVTMCTTGGRRNGLILDKTLTYHVYKKEEI